MKAFILVTGSEFTEGRKIDKNGNYIAKELFERGVDVVGITLAPDDFYLIQYYIKIGLDKADIVIISGGLGPTSDDLTREAVSSAIGVPLVYDEEWLKYLKNYYFERALEFTDERKSMAKIPYGSVPIKSKTGRALGFLKVLDDVKKAVIAVPGVPSEMKDMLEEIFDRVGLKEKKRFVHLFRTFGINELDLNYLLKDIDNLSYNVSPKGVDIFVKDTQKLFLENKIAVIRDRLGKNIYAEDNLEMEEVVGKLLKENKKTISTAESSTGGLIASRIVNVAGSSEYFLGGVVSYSNEAKINILGVKKEDIERYGAVSEPVAKQMVEGAIRIFKTDFALSDTGIAGPTGDTPEKPLGLHYIGFFNGKESVVYKEIYKAERNDVRLYISQFALNLVRLYLSEEKNG
ncbi:competence/damage-inducible protein A [Venenivibrio stagnispumantis]|uniref:CinA-like protein n=1 Tax=Venenivibrio stagnispumantis TaxID=407998 RepID=A0AA45WM87_9AQUI|nr:nicotinamide-nucleotide amidohydrolase family protein [Venenivibrio stagnispumantis]MCW4572797.1 nicotinamide-nucleotide amidohydrolase family protein [Venenivibrio stagnispumantis]SMP13754.1 nicotinamide-nucleotide amidase [Venenivibrio stagnispumantis]